MAEKRGPGRPRIAKEEPPKIDSAVKVDGMTPMQTPKSTVQVDETAPTIYKMLAESGQIDPSKVDYSKFINDLIPDGIAAKYGMKLATVTELAGNADPKLMVSGGGKPGNGSEQPSNTSVSMKDVENAVNSMNLQKVLNAQITDLVGDPTKGGTQTAGEGMGQLMNGLMQMTMIEMLVNKMGGGQSQQQQQNPEMAAMRAQLDAMEKKNEFQAAIAPIQNQISSMEKVIRDLSTIDKRTDPIVENEMKALREQITAMTKMNEFTDALKLTVDPLQKQIDEIGSKSGTDRFDESLRRETEARERASKLENQNLEQRLTNQLQQVHDSIQPQQDPVEQLERTAELLQRFNRITNPDASEEDRGMEIFKTAAEHLGPTLTELASGYKASQQHRAADREDGGHQPAQAPANPTYECPGCGANQELVNEAQREATCTNCGEDVVLDPRTQTVALAHPVVLEPPEPPEPTAVFETSAPSDAEVIEIPPADVMVESDPVNTVVEPMVEVASHEPQTVDNGVPGIVFAFDR